MPKPVLATSPAAAAVARWPAWALILALAAAYFVSARLGLLLAIPGGHVTPVWPPSGIALAALPEAGVAGSLARLVRGQPVGFFR